MVSRRIDLKSFLEPGAACKEGTSGVLCGVCDDDYVLQSDGQCKQCDANADSIVLWVLGALGVLLCLAIASYVLMNMRKQSDTATTLQRPADNAMVNVWGIDHTKELQNKVSAPWVALHAMTGPLKIMFGFVLRVGPSALI